MMHRLFAQGLLLFLKDVGTLYYTHIVITLWVMWAVYCMREIILEFITDIYNTIANKIERKTDKDQEDDDEKSEDIITPNVQPAQSFQALQDYTQILVKALKSSSESTEVVQSLAFKTADLNVLYNIMTTHPQNSSVFKTLKIKIGNSLGPGEYETVMLTDEENNLMKEILKCHKKDCHLQLRHKPRLSEIKSAYYSTMLFSGRPGTGKSSYAENLAKRLGCRVITAANTKLGSTFIHGTSLKIGAIYQDALNAARESKYGLAVVLFDEIDSFAGERLSASDPQCGSRARREETNTILQLIDRNRKLQKTQPELKIIFCFTTNDKDALDGAFLRRMQLQLDFFHLDKGVLTDSIIDYFVKKFALSDIYFKDDTLKQLKEFIDQQDNLTLANIGIVTEELNRFTIFNPSIPLDDAVQSVCQQILFRERSIKQVRKQSSRLGL